MSKAEFVKQALSKCGKNVRINFEDEHLIDILYLLCHGDDADTIQPTGHNLNLIGLYFSHIKNDIPNTIKYYTMAISKGYALAANNLACFYKKQGNVEKMHQYYQIAIDMGNADAMHNIGIHYKYDMGDVKNAKKYFKMAISKGHVDAAKRLGRIYHKQAKYQKMLHCYKIAVDGGDRDTMLQLVIYYRKMKDVINTRKYLQMAFRHGEKTVLEIIFELVSTLYWDYDMNETIISAFEFGYTKEEIHSFLPPSYQSDKQKCVDYLNLCEICFHQRQKIKRQESEIIELKYKPGGPGYEEAKIHFESLQ